MHIDNDENPITLSDAFIMPDYKMYKSVKRIGFSNNDTLDQIIRKFVNYDKSSTMLISGVPGIGKSSITSWIANKYKNDDRVIILRFRDWENEDLRIGLLQDICNTFFCKKKDLENKILIIDGFDEMKSLNRREDLINAFVSDIKDYENFKCIITSRPAYVESIWFNNVIELKEFDIHKVETFCKVILGNTLCKKTEIRLNLEVLGIPVILYMALMSGIDISKNNTKPELYNRIFSAIGGIFDRFCYKGIGYYGGAQILRDPRNIKEYLQFLRKVAFMMFEEDNLMIEVDANEIPELKVQEYTVKILEFPIKNLFEKNGSHIEFIHKSLYEYFVSEFFYWTIVNSLQANNLKELAGTLGYIFKRNVISYEILEFLEYKIRNGELNNKFDIINNAFQIMLQDGMSFYVNGHYKNINKCEMQIFANILEFLHLWEKCYLEFDNSICNYLSPYSFGDLNFSKADFRRVNLKGISLADVNLKNANFIGMDLKGIEFECSDLEEANFSNADLSDADLRGANLDEIILDNAILEGTIIDEIQICNLEDIYDLDATKVYLNEKHNIIDYKEYKKSV